MGLGGMARDSIVNLSKLAHDNDDGDFDKTIDGGNKVQSNQRRITPAARRQQSSGLNGSWNGPSTRSESFDSLLGFDDGACTTTACSSSDKEPFETSLNDGLVVPLPPARPVTPLKTVSATNSRSLDSYRGGSLTRTKNDAITATSTSTSTGATTLFSTGAPTPTTSTVLLYSGFNYEGYADYYSEDFSSYASGSVGGTNSSYDSYKLGGEGWGRREEDGNDNLFCCLFAPWMTPQQTKSIENGESIATSLPLPPSSTATARDIVVDRVSAEQPPEETVVKSPSPHTALLMMTQSSITAEVVEGICPPQLPNADIPLFSKSKTLEEEEDNDFKNNANPKSTTPLISKSFLDEVVPCAVAAPTMLITSLSSLSVDTGGQGNNANTCSDPPSLPPVKGILKVRRCSISIGKVMDDVGSTCGGGGTRGPTPAPTPINGRKLFPTYEPKKRSDGPGGPRRSIEFNPMARVLTLPSRRDMQLSQRAQIWWQKCDYDEFKKTGRIISKAMECGGSEVWLTSSNAWGDRSARAPVMKRTSESDAYNQALSRYVTNDNDEKSKGGVGEDDDKNKWWCKFGHSRRGLEHVVSNSEGKARQQSVVLATQMVLDEQRRQRASRTKDPNKLRNVAMQYTSWARDLALAAGYADAEAVKKNFDATAWGGSRARHFAKRMSSTGSIAGAGSLAALIVQHVGKNDSATGSRGVARVAVAFTSQILDANTHVSPIAKSARSRHNKVASAVGVDEDISTLVMEEEVSLKKRAKGFMPGGGDEGTSMMVHLRSVKA